MTEISPLIEDKIYKVKPSFIKLNYFFALLIMSSISEIILIVENVKGKMDL